MSKDKDRDSMIGATLIFCVAIFIVLLLSNNGISRQHGEIASMLDQCNITLTDEENNVE